MLCSKLHYQIFFESKLFSFHICAGLHRRRLNSATPATLETTQGQIDGFFSQLIFKYYLREVASVGNLSEDLPLGCLQGGCGCARPWSVETLRFAWRVVFAPAIWVQGAGCRVQGAGCRVQGAGYMVQASGANPTPHNKFQSPAS